MRPGEVSAPCGLCSSDGIIGLLDVPDAFLDPERMKTGLLWFTRGYIEYQFPNTHTTVDRVGNAFLRTSHLRTPGRMQNNFANECFVDEVAAAAGQDPVALRLRYLTDERSRAVVADTAGRTIG